MSRHRAPLALVPVPAGFPNPAEDAGSIALDLNEHVIKHPASTFYMCVEGDSMVGAGIHSGDLIVVDKSLEVRSGDAVVAALEGEFTLKYFFKEGKQGWLKPANPSFKPIPLSEESDLQIWGVVTHVIRTLERGHGHGA